ncbi:MAG: hypothetical protein QGG40_22095, partial [Myxococcota bacterium]|nr:hypothetical protein [Myxococcota bacterium]
MPDEALESELSGPERSAILIMYLGSEVAKNILRRMTVEDVRKVGLAMAEIERVDAVVIEKVVADFIRDLHEVSLMPRSGEEFVNVVLPELLDEDRRREIIPMLTRRVSTHFEQFVEARPPGAIAALLEDEHPQ